jgi:hypothetical protein
MTLYSQYIYSLLLYIINKKQIFNVNNEMYKYKTRAHNNLYLSKSNLMKFSKGAYTSGVKVFNHLPQTIKMLFADERRFKTALRRFYSILFIQ